MSRPDDAMENLLMFTPTELAQQFPYARYHSDFHLVTWHPDGVLDNDRADQAAEFIELAEKLEGHSFNRYFDMCGYSGMEIEPEHLIRLARRRRRYRGPKVKSAFYAERLVSLAIARIYQELMVGSRIEVCIFRDRAVAAKWLGVPETILQRPKKKRAK
jgi:hypothetical protein